MKVVNKKTRIIIAILILIECFSIFLTYKSFSNRNIIKETNKNIADKNTFAIMLENDEGDYTESSVNTWPKGEYRFNSSRSVCYDNNGNIITDVLTYDNSTKTAYIKTKKTTFCYLYFDKRADIQIDVSTDGVEGGVPTTLGYSKTIICDDGSSPAWNYKYNRLEFSNVNSEETKCKLTYTKESNNYPSIIDTVKNAPGIVDEGIAGFRYEGKNPDNYVWFNNELWRIIGYVPTKDANGNDTNLVKIVRAETIGAYTLGYNSSSVEDTRIYNILNDLYYNRKDGTNGNYCYSGGTSSSKATCDFTGNGLNLYARSMIKPVQWAIGSQATDSYVSTHYNSEISEYTNVSTGIKVGLISVSDYGYSVPSNYCDRTTIKLSRYNRKNCAEQNWMLTFGALWTLSPIKDEYHWFIMFTSNGGYIYNGHDMSAYLLYPTIFLDERVYITKGNGNIINPYYLAM